MLLDTATQISLVGLLGGFVGYCLSAWRRRVCPWISLLKFDEVRKSGDRIDVPKPLREASKKSHCMKDLVRETATLHEVYVCLASAKLWLKRNEDSASQLRSGLEELDEAATPEDITKAVVSLLTPTGLSELIEISILRSQIQVTPDPGIEPLFKYFVDEEQKDGCFCFELPTAILSFGEGLSKSQYRRPRLEPFVETVARLEKDKIAKAFRDVEPILKEQREANKAVAEAAQQIIDEHSRWTCFFTVSNIGASSFIIFPTDTKLSVTGKRIRPFDIPCSIIMKDHDGHWVDADGATMIQSGSTVELGAVTLAVQKDIEDGAILRDVYTAASGHARLSLRVLGREIPWRITVKSTTLKFGSVQ